MIASRRLVPLLRRAQDHKAAAVRQLAERQRQLQLSEQRLGELHHYASEYASPPANCVNIGQLRSQHAFVNRLLGAVEQQRLAVEHSRQSVEQQRTGLIHASRQHQVLEHLDTLSRAAEQTVVERRQQRELDELGARNRNHPMELRA